MASASSFFGGLLEALTNDELLAAGPDLLAAGEQLGSTTDTAGQMLIVHKAAAALLSDQVTVRLEAQQQVLGVALKSLAGAIAAAKAANPLVQAAAAS